MSRAMALKSSKSRKKDNTEYKAKLKKAVKDGQTNTRIMMHNMLMLLIFGLAIVFTSLIAIEIAYAAIGLIVGNANRGSFSTLADLIIVVTAILMVSGFMLFFSIRFENWMIRKMRERFWHKDKATGEIIKGEMAKIAVTAAEDDSDIKLYENENAKNNGGKKGRNNR